MKVYKIVLAFVFALITFVQVNAQFRAEDPVRVLDDNDIPVVTPPSGDGYRKVVWVHGLEGSTASWHHYADLFQSQRQMKSVTVEYANKSATGLYADVIEKAPNIISKQLDLPKNNVMRSANSRNIFVAHSMGGLVTRELDRQDTKEGLNPYFGGFVTFGTPHRGAEIAQAVLDGRADAFMDDGLRNVLAGPSLTFSPVIRIAGIFGYDISVDALVTDMKAAIFKAFDFATGPMRDLPPTSDFVKEINRFTHNKKMIAIAAKEDAPSMYREISSLKIKLPTDLPLNVTDDGDVTKGVKIAVNVYKGIEDYYWWRKTLTIFNRGKRESFAKCEIAYRRGWQWLDNAPTIWNSMITAGQNGANDGIVPETSAKGLNGAFTSEVEGVNHQECMNHPNVTQKLRDVFDGQVGTQDIANFFATPFR